VKPEERGIFYFSHSGTVQKLLAFLRLYEGERPLTSDSYTPGRDWAWRTSRISPFGANAAFVLQTCGAEQFKVGLYVNEQLGQQSGSTLFCCKVIFGIRLLISKLSLTYQQF
jgi:hypothetical protein